MKTVQYSTLNMNTMHTGVREKEKIRPSQGFKKFVITKSIRHKLTIPLLSVQTSLQNKFD